MCVQPDLVGTRTGTSGTLLVQPVSTCGPSHPSSVQQPRACVPSVAKSYRGSVERPSCGDCPQLAGSLGSVDYLYPCIHTSGIEVGLSSRKTLYVGFVNQDLVGDSYN